MARILIATIPVIGHLNPILSIARALVARGHQVRWYSGNKYRAKIEATGAPFIGMTRGRDFDDANLNGEFPGRAQRRGLEQIKFDLKHLFADSAPGQFADLENIASRWEPDLVLADPGMLGAMLLQERHGIPCGLVNVVPYMMRSHDTAPFGLGLQPGTSSFTRVRNAALNWAIEHVIFRDVQSHWVKVRRQLGFGTRAFMLDTARDAALFLMSTVPGFEYPRSDLPSNVHFIGMLPAETPMSGVSSEFLADLNERRPVVHVSQGTIANARPDLVASTLAALADEDVLVVVATGGRSREELGLTHVPANVRIASFLPYDDLLPRTAAMVTNGGYGGVQLALSYGVPLVVAGTTEDKPEVAARVAWSGAGINLKTATPTPEAVKAAVRAVLDRPMYRVCAHALSAEYAAYDAVSRAVNLIEAVTASPAHVPVPVRLAA